MKKLTFLIVMGVLIISLAFAQKKQQEGTTQVDIYSLFVNVVSENFRLPLLGVINIAEGSHYLPQFGFITYNQNDFTSLQTSFINVTGGDFSGVQLGFVNTTVKSAHGMQLGFVNTVAGEKIQGLQMGFVNTAANGFDGAQIGFINAAEKINGLQLGFINYADSIENGIPIGLISVVSDGGYRVVEFSTNEMAPVNIAFKIGVEKLYTTINVSYNPTENDISDALFFGAGLGSIFTIYNEFFFNPEMIFSHNVFDKKLFYLSLVPHLGYNLAPGLGFVFGPSITWEYDGDAYGSAVPYSHAAKHKINNKNHLYVGGRIGIRFIW